MKKQVVVSECDGCGKEVTFPVNSARDIEKTVLPSNWLYVQGITNLRTVFERDLCEECAKPVLGAAGAGMIGGSNAVE